MAVHVSGTRNAPYSTQGDDRGLPEAYLMGLGSGLRRPPSGSRTALGQTAALYAFQVARGPRDARRSAIARSGPRTASHKHLCPCRVAARLKGQRARLLPRSADPALLRAVARARRWFEEIACGRIRSSAEIA